MSSIGRFLRGDSTLRRPPLSREAAAAVRGLGAAGRTRIERAIAAVAGAGRPSRVALDRAHLATMSSENGGEAWELLAALGIIPDTWVAKHGRAFLRADRQQTWPSSLALVAGIEKGIAQFDTSFGAQFVGLSGLPSSAAVGDLFWTANGARVSALLDAPPSIDLAVAMASDVSGIERAEELARTIHQALLPWGAAPNPKLVWSLPENHHQEFPTWSGSDARGARYHLSSALHAALQNKQLTEARKRCDAWFFGLRSGISASAESFGGHLISSLLWAHAAALGIRVPAPPPQNEGDPATRRIWPVSLTDQPFSELPDPYDATLDLYALGYGILDTLGPYLFLNAPNIA